MQITLRYYAAAQAAAGTAAEHLEMPDGGTLADALEAVRAVVRPARDGAPQLADVLRRCSFLVNEVAAKDHARPLASGDQVDVLPPFAGG
ncbi:molybdopterin synthase sulfur carrier subunit [Sinomonas cyclohexanicum]|uniref:Molybdopterin synthase sulfur carrier subunit n=1 Tax=Sinomonas cyclohexanicum TaxID=322009 RepID=A0ABM7PU23_SINCY|nr:MoaD/ThiS family protein [Corynebacterium cyclohexanicum]BCT75750.1 molybdopterin synthase sulfur carrier subunit [Corynebacterium cyclohexanicum]